MLIAAYVVGPFLVASVYAMGMLRGRRDRYHRLGFIIAFTVGAIFIPIQMGVGDSLARWVYNNEPQKFAAIELVPKTKSDVPETLLGRFNSEGTEVEGGLPIPGLASILSDPGTGTATVVQGRNAFPADEQPTVSEANVVHLAWDVMVGLGTLMSLLAAWYGLAWLFRRDFPQTKWFLRIASITGVLAVITMEAGWVVTEVGRQPWIVRNYMKVENAATGQHRGVDHVPRGRRALPRRRRDDDPRAAGHEPSLARGGGARRARRALRAQRPDAARAGRRVVSAVSRGPMPDDGRCPSRTARGGARAARRRRRQERER